MEGSVGWQARLRLFSFQLAQGIGDFIEQVARTWLTRTSRRHNAIGTIEAPAISATFRD